MTKKYKLLKDLPDGSKPGDIYVPIESSDKVYINDSKRFKGKISWSSVENNPEWFEEVKEPTVFVHELRYAAGGINGYSFQVHQILSREMCDKVKQAIEDVLNSSNKYDNNLKNAHLWTKMPSADTVVKDWKGHKFENGKLTVPQDVAERLRPLTPEYQQEKLYTQAELDKAIEDAFWASREMREGEWGGRRFMIACFRDYKATLTNQK